MKQQRRGIVAVAMIATIVVCSLVVLGFVVLGATDSDMTVRQADAMRAFYAADSGTNMAVRELIRYSDFDGDGAVGSISNDNNPANDPSIGTARVSVSPTLSGSMYTLTSAGRSNESRRAIATTAEGLAGGQRWMLYCDWPNAIPAVAEWNGRTWGPPTWSLDNGAMIYWALLKRCTPRVELIGATLNNAREIRVMVYNGAFWDSGGWGNQLLLTTDAGSRLQRPFYICYERSSGDGLVVFRKVNSPNVFYRTWNGSAWSAEQSVNIGLSAPPRYMKLVPKPGGDEIMLAVLDEQNDLAASVWNGSAFVDTVMLEPDCSSTVQECFDIAYQTATGRCIVAWGKTGSTQPQYRVYNGAAWLPANAAPSVGGVPVWIRLAPHPSGSSVALGSLDLFNDVNVNLWDGNSWGTNTELSINASTLASRALDLAWEPDGARALCVYADGGQQTPYYNIYSGGAWGVRQTAPSLGYVPLLIQLDPSTLGKEVMLCASVQTGQNGLSFLRWNGTAFANQVLLEDNVSGPNPMEVFMISDSPPNAVGGSARVTGWGEVQP